MVLLGKINGEEVCLQQSVRPLKVAATRGRTHFVDRVSLSHLSLLVHQARIRILGLAVGPSAFFGEHGSNGRLDWFS